MENFLERQDAPDETHVKTEDASAAAVKGLSSGGFGAVGLSDEMQAFLGDGTTSLARSQARLEMALTLPSSRNCMAASHV